MGEKKHFDILFNTSFETYKTSMKKKNLIFNFSFSIPVRVVPRVKCGSKTRPARGS